MSDDPFLKKKYVSPNLSVLGRVDPAFAASLAEQEALREELKEQIADMSPQAQLERHLELIRKAGDLIILTNQELEELILLREALKKTGREKE